MSDTTRVGETGSLRSVGEPTSFCIDYGHHGSERCVFCGVERCRPVYGSCTKATGHDGMHSQDGPFTGKVEWRDPFE